MSDFWAGFIIGMLSGMCLATFVTWLRIRRMIRQAREERK